MFKYSRFLWMLSWISGFALVSGSVWAQVRWDLPTAYPLSSFQTQTVQQFADEVKQLTNGRLLITVHPNGSLYKATEIKRALQTGQVPAAEWLISSSANENPLFSIDSIPFLATSYTDARHLYLAARPAQEKALSAQGMKILFSVAWPGQSLYSVKPLSSPADLAGTKMRSYNPSTARIAQLLRAQPVTIQLTELSQALATGGVDNFLTSSASGVENKLYEHVKYFYTVNAWHPRNITAVNQKAFDALDKPTQDAVLQAASKVEWRGWQASETASQEYLKELAKNGMTITDPPESIKTELKKVGDTLTAEWLQSTGAEGQSIISDYKKRAGR